MVTKLSKLIIQSYWWSHEGQTVCTNGTLSSLLSQPWADYLHWLAHSILQNILEWAILLPMDFKYFSYQIVLQSWSSDFELTFSKYIISKLTKLRYFWYHTKQCLFVGSIVWISLCTQSGHVGAFHTIPAVQINIA